MRLKIYVDGASHGNPGPAGIGILILDESGSIVGEISEYVGEKTNNEAEYLALIRALREALKFSPRETQIFSDSELIVKQLRGEYRVRGEHLKPLHSEVLKLLSKLKNIEIKYVEREENRVADRLANQAIEKRIKPRS